MSAELDMNSNNINNADVIVCNDITVAGSSVAASAAASAASAAAALVSENNAATSETNAAASEVSVDSTYSEFDTRYLGEKASDPTLDNQGAALIVGAQYFNSTDDTLYVYTGTIWVTGTSTTSAVEAAASAAAALVSENNAATSETNADSDATQTAADRVVTTQDATDTAADAIATAADRVQTGLDVISSGENAAIALNSNLYEESLVKLIRPDQSKGLQDLQKQAVYPISFNQQWGGMGYSGLPDGTLGEVATGYIITDGSFMNIGSGSTNDEKVAQGFKVSNAQTLSTVFIKMSKEGNPTDNTTLEIWSDSSGPSAIITNGAATSIASTTISDKSDGEWVKFEFPTPPSLSADVLYFITVGRSGAFSTSNRVRWLSDTTSATYPHGTLWELDASWTENAAERFAFVIVADANILQSGLSGFDGALHCYEGAPLDQSGAFYFANDELNHKRGLIHFAATGWDKDKTFYDSGLGSDINRIVIRTNVTTGFAQVDLYENDENKLTVTGTTDISTGNHIVSVGYRAEGDGADFLKLYVDGASEGTELTSQTITLDRSFEDGHTTIGGGFPLAPTWTDNQDMSVLPSADGWTWTGTATESNAMVVDGGILYHNGAGYASTESGYYAKTTTLDNTTGWVVETKVKVKENTNTTTSEGVEFSVNDGTTRVRLFLHEYFIEIFDDANINYIQINLTKETTLKLTGKGSDFYLYADGALIFDGEGLMDFSTANNIIAIGDTTATSTENGSAEWHYLKYYEGVYLPGYSSVQISEQCNWNDDKSTLLSTIYNSGSIQSVKTLAGMSENYVKTVKQVISVKGIASSPTTTSTSFVPLDDLSVFSFGLNIYARSESNLRNSSAGSLTYLGVSIDGIADEVSDGLGVEMSVANDVDYVSAQNEASGSGLHFITSVWRASTGTGTAYLTKRKLRVEAE